MTPLLNKLLLLLRRQPGQLVLCGALAALVAGSGCSIRKYALNKASDVVASGGNSFASDNDPELIKAAAPFSLKLMESFLLENPEHKELLTASARGFTQYSYAFVQQEADELEPRDLAAAEALRARAKKLYARAQGYGMRGLELRHPGFNKQLVANPHQAVRGFTRKADVPLLYWTAAAWASEIVLSKDNPELIGQIPAMEALIYRALELDESYNLGAIHTFLISYEMGRPGGAKDAEARARRHFERAMELSKGLDASPLVAFAEAVTIQKQELKEFESLLNRALAINPDADLDIRLVNVLMQRRAKWLLSRKSDLFLTE